MPKISNYPRKTFDTAILISETVEKLGGKCTEQLLGDKLGKKKGGGSFNADINSAVKHGLITKDKDNLKITDLFKNIKLSYTEKEKKDNLAKAFLLPDTYREILERFNGKELPVDVLDKMLIKEYGVADNLSQTVANNLIKGAEAIGLIVSGKVTLSKETIAMAEKEAVTIDDQNEQAENNSEDNSAKQENGLSGTIKENFRSNASGQKDVVININIQLTVPETTNEEVYEKFFSAMKRNLLS